LVAETNAVARLRAEFSRKGYRCAPIALGSNSDAYQPIERRYRISRSLIEVMAQCRHPFSVVTKSALVVRDLDLLAPLARQRLVTVHFSITTLDNRLSARMERSEERRVGKEGRAGWPPSRRRRRWGRAMTGSTEL